MLEKSQIVGSEKIVIFEKTSSQFNFDQLVNLGESLNDYEVVGYSPVYVGDRQLFEKVYEKRDNK
ncbi:hypothetical protein [Bacillus safensis]|uniref:hypothetical protein n=1 Tax=Bacillus safensis TaxID=561879 RepID=UPI002E1F5F6A|nr:hypothetical protein [Bacillus safensis]